MSADKLDDLLGVDRPISRRDFVNGVLVGAGALGTAAYAGSGHAAASLDPSGSAWTGYGGVGDYRWSNGNTRSVIDAAHGIRDGEYEDGTNTGTIEESFDVVVIGGGFAGISAAYEFSKNARADERLLLLENHPFFGGEAKQNEMIVGSRTLIGPQGSNAGRLISRVRPGSGYDVYGQYYRELGIPADFDLEPVAGEAEKYRLPHDHFEPMLDLGSFETGFFFKKTGWSRDPLAQGFRNTPWNDDERRDMVDFVGNARDLVSREADAGAWLDTMSYKALLQKLGYGENVIRYIDPFVAVGNFGLCSDAISARAAQLLGLPGTVATEPRSDHKAASTEPLGPLSFPGGNAAIMRVLMARTVPGCISGTVDEILANRHRTDLSMLDRAGSPVRVRLSSTAVRVEHDGAPGTAGSVIVTYVRNGTLRRVRAKSVIMATGSWVTRRVVRDMPDQHRQAFTALNYGPVLTINVAVRNWRFFDRLGIVSARWFEGFGWHVCARRNYALGRQDVLNTDSPMMLTFYVPVLFPGESAAVQGAMARQQIFDTPYADYERQVRMQMHEMFGPAGFDVRRDIAGIIVNRWGHAYSAPPPGFFTGKYGGPAPGEMMRRRHGRIVFAHSEMLGRMNMANAMNEGRRGALEAAEIVRAG